MPYDNAASDHTYGRIDRVIRRKYKGFKRDSIMLIHGSFMRVLFFVGLGWKFNQWKCKHNMYSKFLDGRCMYCGKKHN